MNENLELRQQRKQIAVQMDALCTEFRAKKDPTPQDQGEFNEKFDRMDADVKRLTENIERIERSSALNAEYGAARPPQADPSGPRMSADERQAKQEAYSKAYWRFMSLPLKGDDTRLRALSDNERQLLAAGAPEQRATIGVEGGPPFGAYPGSTAGLVVPVGFVADIEVALKYYGPMLDGGMDMPKILVTETGGPLPFPTSNDTTITGELTTETSAINVQDVSTGIITFGAFKFDSKIVKVSWEMLQDAGVNIPDFLSNTFATRLGRALNTYFTTGTGSGQPNGIITASVSGGTALGANTNDGTSAANTIGSDDLTTLEHSVDPLYRRGARYMMHDSVLAALKKVKDKYGRPLWLPGVAVNAPDTINGYKYAINNDMDQLQASASSPTVSKNTLLFGDLSKYMIRRVRDITVLRLDELYAANGYVGFVAFCRYDGQLIDAGTHPTKYLVNTY